MNDKLTFMPTSQKASKISQKFYALVRVFNHMVREKLSTTIDVVFPLQFGL